MPADLSKRRSRSPGRPRSSSTGAATPAGRRRSRTCRCGRFATPPGRVQLLLPHYETYRMIGSEPRTAFAPVCRPVLTSPARTRTPVASTTAAGSPLLSPPTAAMYGRWSTRSTRGTGTPAIAPSGPTTRAGTTRSPSPAPPTAAAPTGRPARPRHLVAASSRRLPTRKRPQRGLRAQQRGEARTASSTPWFA